MNIPLIIVKDRKAHYGLKQAPRLWHNDRTTFLLILGSTQSQADLKLYKCSIVILFVLYVDDISMIYASMESARQQ